MAAEFTDTQAGRTSLSAEGQFYELTKTVFFEAAHFMSGKAEEHARHKVLGHSFSIEATVAGIVKPGEEWVADLTDLAAALEATAGRLDHRLLNGIDGLETPTLERICLWAAADLKAALPGLSRIAVARPSLNERCELVLKQAGG